MKAEPININLKDRIRVDMETAMKARDAKHLGVIRLLMAAIKQREVDERTSADKRITLDDVQILAVIDKMIKQRQDSATQFQNANRLDLAEQETYEISVLQTYLPAQLTENEIDALVSQAVSHLNATSIKDMGRLMAELKPKMQGRADMAVVSEKIKAILK